MTRIRRHPLTAVLAPVVLLLTALGASGCDLLGRPTATPPEPIASPSVSGSPSASPDPSASPSPTAELRNFRTDGTPPYLLGRTLTELQANPGLADVGPMDGCSGNVVARGVGSFGDLYLHFRADGRLYLLINRDRTLATPSGMYLGDGLDDGPGGRPGLRTTYDDAFLQPGVITNSQGSAFSVRTSDGNGILFILDGSNLVTEMHAGLSSGIRSAFTAGSQYC